MADTVRLAPYDQGYRDGWHDIHVSRRPRRARRRRASAEYATGYGHGRLDGACWPSYREWWPDFAQAPHIAASPARFEAIDTPGPAHGATSTPDTSAASMAASGAR
jgi:hypothetical protein